MAPDPKDDDDQPSARQLLHAATGDREAEGRALADRADEDLSDEDAEEAVRRAHGDVQEEPSAERDVARPADAEAVRDEDGAPG
jgi:hypothetical protein